MKARFIQGIVAAAALSLGSLVYGQTSNAIPYEQTFEGMTGGQSILLPGFSNGWYGDTNSLMVAIATNVSYTWAGGLVLHPVTNAAHTKVLYFQDASLSNEFEIYDAFSPTNTTVDFMVQAVRHDELQTADSNRIAGSQTALYLDTNGFLNVWHGLDNSGANNTWMTFTNAPPLGTSDWARVTVAFDYTGDALDNGPGDSFFKINVNGLPLAPINGGYGPSTFGYANGVGPFLRTANPVKQVRAFALSGSGKLDDLVVTTNEVTNFFGELFTLVGSAGANGSITPVSTNVQPGGSANFVITADGGYRIASLTTNGTPVAGMTFDNGSVATNFTWSNVQANGTLAATFTALTTYTLTGSAGANGVVTPASTNVPPGGSANFVITADGGYRIAALTTNGTPVAGMTFDNNSVATNFTWSNVQDNGTLAATFTAQTTYTLTGGAGAHGTVTPASTNVLAGASVNFTITASGFYRIASLTTNGTPVAGMTFGNNSLSTNFTWSNVQDNGALNALFTAQVANNPAATPYWWLAQFGLTNYDADAVADQDHDGLLTWQEFIVATDPTNYASVLKVLSVTSDGVNDTVKWLSTTGSPSYNLFYSLSLTNTLNGWTPSSNNIVQTAPTNSITITQPGSPVYYKVTVTN